MLEYGRRRVAGAPILGYIETGGDVTPRMVPCARKARRALAQAAPADGVGMVGPNANSRTNS